MSKDVGAVMIASGLAAIAYSWGGLRMAGVVLVLTGVIETFVSDLEQRP